MRAILALGIIGLGVPGMWAVGAHARSDMAMGSVAMTSMVFREQLRTDGNGARHRTLVPMDRATPGDPLVFLIRYENRGERPIRDLILPNSLPRHVELRDGGDMRVSVDGGQRWGRLSDLRVRDSDGVVRDARMGDVTHLRWTMPRAIASGDVGEVSFRGIAR